MTVSEPITKVNLERLTNGIYAFTMTLMIRNIQVPPQGTVTDLLSLARYAEVTIPTIFDYIGAFLILGMFWLFFFQMFHRMKTYDYRFLHLHLFSLMIVVFLPFTSSFRPGETLTPVSDFLFQLNYLVLAILLVVEWNHARNHPDLLVPELTEPESSFLAQKFLVPLGVSLVGMVFIFTGFGFTDVLYLLPFIIITIFFRSPPQDG